ncbi:MAG TPA: hypothetical protein VLD57_06575 [Blastocatellia bacterium]|nr:hypothetical protein [Blastocatellia bacterium]
MARGWESKAIEEQISAAEARKDAQAREALTAAEIERLKRKEGLVLERANIERQMKAANKRRHLVMLERALAHIEAEIEKLEQVGSNK